MPPTGYRPPRIVVLIILLWAFQSLWLAKRFGPDLFDLAARIVTGRIGAAVRPENPFYSWLREVEKVIPSEATYIFLDRYEAGRYIEARYHLFPRSQILLLPETPPSYLFYALRRYEAAFVLAPEGDKPLGPGLNALLDTSTCQFLPLPEPGRLYRVNFTQLTGFFYD